MDASRQESALEPGTVRPRRSSPAAAAACSAPPIVPQQPVPVVPKDGLAEALQVAAMVCSWDLVYCCRDYPHVRHAVVA
jgi:hypothetical protein